MPESAPHRPPNCTGIVGLGLVGLAISERLLRAGIALLGWDISAGQRAAFASLGGALATGTKEIFTQCDRVLLSLPDDTVVSSVLREATEAMWPGQIIIDTSTGSPETTETLGREMQSCGVFYLDATISGSSAQVRSGEILVMVGGLEGALERCRNLLQCFARRVMHTGPVGSGARMKLVTNLVLGLNRSALAEGLVFAKALGLDGEQTLSIFRESMAYSRIMDTKGEKMLRGDFEPQARLSQHLKDVRLMHAAAARAGIRLPMSEAHQHLLELAETLGWGELDNSAILRALEQCKDHPLPS